MNEGNDDGIMTNYLWNTNFFEWAKEQPAKSIDTILTDPPYTAFRNQIGENQIKDKSFDLPAFCEECCRLLKENGLFISFCSMHLMKDYFKHFEGKLKFRCEQIWDKRPNRSWIAYSLPLRHLEYIVYFGKGKLDFRTGEKKKKYDRTQFGGMLRNTNANTKEFAEGQYQQILTFPIPRKVISEDNDDVDRYNHPTRKSPQFSLFFEKVIEEPGFVLDPCCGTGALIWSFKHAIGIDIGDWSEANKSFSGAKKEDAQPDLFSFLG